MRIFKNKYYIMSKQVTDSLGNWQVKPILSIVTGHKAKNEKPYIIVELDKAHYNSGHYCFELNDGHIKGYRPTTTSIMEVITFLDNNPFSSVYIMCN